MSVSRRRVAPFVRRFVLDNAGASWYLTTYWWTDGHDCLAMTYWISCFTWQRSSLQNLALRDSSVSGHSSNRVSTPSRLSVTWILPLGSPKAARSKYAKKWNIHYGF